MIIRISKPAVHQVVDIKTSKYTVKVYRNWTLVSEQYFNSIQEVVEYCNSLKFKYVIKIEEN